MNITTKRTIISICGGSGGGKSLLAKKLVERLGFERAVRVPADFYLKSNPYPTLAEFFQHPLEYDWDLIDTVFREADGSNLTTPYYDFINFRRVTTVGGRCFVMRPIVFIDAMVPYPKAQTTIFIHTPEEERRRRIIERDKMWKTQVIDYWELHQVTLADMLLKQSKFDLALDGMASIEEKVDKTLAFLRFSDLIPNENFTVLP